MKSISLVLLFGGMSEEYAVSLCSAYEVLCRLPHGHYTVYPVGITRDGRWLYYCGDYAALPNDTWHLDTPHLFPVFLRQGAFHLPDFTTSLLVPDVIFPVLHGQYGEDGRLQGLLDCYRLPYVGSGCRAGALCMDKHLTKVVLAARGLPVVDGLLLRDNCPLAERCEQVEQTLPYPVFVKPANSGSSVGAAIARNRAELQQALVAAARIDSKVLAEAYTDGVEAEVAVLDDGERVVSLPGEVEPGAPFYDYDTKYKTHTAKLHVPARLPAATAAELMGYAGEAFDALDCRHLCRVDFFVRRRDGRVFVNEVNTLPGFTARSMYPLLLEHMGVPYPRLLARLIRAALPPAITRP
ncbi:MAG: D-alanine--D-alanine ligase family protein [Eubacteriales bacterium]